MPTFEIQTPSGKILTIEAADEGAAMAGARQWHDQNGAAPALRERLTAGEAFKDGTTAAAHGLASFAGAPVDILTGALNLGAKGVNALAGTDLKPIERPFGGSESLKGAADTGLKALGMEPPAYDSLPTGNKVAHRIAEAGTMLATGGVAGAARLAAGAGQPSSSVGRLLTDVFAPAREATARTAIGDMGAAAGMGAAQAAVDVNRDTLDQSGPAGTAITVLAPLAGGIAGGVGTAAVRSGAGRAAGAVRHAVAPDPSLPMDMATGRSVAPRVADRAATELQGAALDAGQAAEAAGATARDFRGQGMGVLPAAGDLSGDVGLIGRTDALRRTSENRASARLARRDADLSADATDRVDGLALGANPRAPAAFAEREAARQRDAAGQAVTEAQARVDAVAREDAAHAAELGGFMDRQATAGAALDHAVVEQGLRPAIARKNELFAAAGQSDTPVSPEPIHRAAAAERADLEAVPLPLRGAATPSAVLEAAEGLGRDGAPVTMREIAATRPIIAAAQLEARRAGNYALADRLGRMKASFDAAGAEAATQGDPRAVAAASNVRENFAPVWNRGPGDEATLFRRDFNLDPNSRSKTPSSETAKRFLSSPEKAQALARVLNSTPDPTAGFAAGREYLMGDLARSGAVDLGTGRLNVRNLRKWVADNGEIAAAIPGLRDELDGISRQATGRQEQATRLAAELDAAARAQHLTSEQIDKGALGLMTGRDGRSLVGALLEGKDPAASLREVTRTLKDSPDAMRGLARAIAEHVTEAAPAGGRTASADRIANVLERFGPALGDAMPPEELQRLRTSLTQLQATRQRGAVTAGPGGEGGSRLASTVGSALNVAPGGSGATGQLLRALVRVLPDRTTPRVNALVTDALIDSPETLGALLTRKVTPPGHLANWRANNLAAGVMGVQSAGSSGER